ncbi:uncharacterized protein DS421_16g551560 [Arachis hypogaea]|nr:uncharacterized protein DS421_16g551560 [Arachis hypogaea]
MAKHSRAPLVFILQRTRGIRPSSLSTRRCSHTPSVPPRLTNGAATFLSQPSPYLSPTAVTLSLSALSMSLTSHPHDTRHHSPASESRWCCTDSRLLVMTSRRPLATTNTKCDSASLTLNDDCFFPLGQTVTTVLSLVVLFFSIAGLLLLLFLDLCSSSGK